jgi:hypothetical protein
MREFLGTMSQLLFKRFGVFSEDIVEKADLSGRLCAQGLAGLGEFERFRLSHALRKQIGPIF